MRIKLIRCHICSYWYSPVRAHCPTCCAHRRFAFLVTPSGIVQPKKHYHLNEFGKELVSGLAPSAEGMIDRLIKHLGGPVDMRDS